MENYAKITKSISLEKYGIKNPTEIIYNPSYEFLYKEEIDPHLNSDDFNFIKNSINKGKKINN